MTLAKENFALNSTSLTNIVIFLEVFFLTNSKSK
jgi:hypothetical protein